MKLLYQADELPERIEVRLSEETVWLSQQQINNCFRKQELNRISVVKDSLTNNVFRKGELERHATCAKFAQVRKEGRILIEK